MNSTSFHATQLVHEYLSATGDTLTTDVCESLGLPYGKHYFFDLRHRLASFSNFGCVQNGNHSADRTIGSYLSAPAALKRAIMALPDDTFATNQLRHQTRLSIGAMSKALRKLENDGVITRVSSSRPCTWRRLPMIRPDFTKVFMEVHGFIDPPSSIPLGQLPLLANRALCGKSIDGMELMKAVTDMTSRYSRISLPVPPTRALEPFLLAVLKGAGDFRAVTRALEKVLREAKTIRRAFDRLSNKDGLKCPLADFTLPHEWFVLFEQPGGISSFVEAVTDALGAELHPKEATYLSDQAVEKTLEDLKNQGISGGYDALKNALINIDPSFHGLTLSILHDNIQNYVKKMDMPVRNFNVKELYRKVALEMVQDKTRSSVDQVKNSTMDSLLRRQGGFDLPRFIVRQNKDS